MIRVQQHLFSIALGALLLIGLVGLILSSHTSKQVGVGERRINALQARLDNLAQLNPQPTVGNVQVVEEEVVELTALLRAYGDAFAVKEPLATESDAIAVLSRIQGLTVDFRSRFREKDIHLTANESFSFSRYGSEGEAPRPEVVPQLARQVDILEQLLMTLLECNPSALVRVEREGFELAQESGSRNGNRRDGRGDFFEIPAEASARVPGLIETMAFRFTFVGYTDSLRQFLNRLGVLELPVVIRNVEVSLPPLAAPANSAPRRGEVRDTASAFAALFGQPDSAEVEAAVQPESQQKPIIENNQSQFRVTVEFVELKLDQFDRGMESGDLE